MYVCLRICYNMCTEIRGEFIRVVYFLLFFSFIDIDIFLIIDIMYNFSIFLDYICN